jgi:hypothetical protein
MHPPSLIVASLILTSGYMAAQPSAVLSRPPDSLAGSSSLAGPPFNKAAIIALQAKGGQSALSELRRAFLLEPNEETRGLISSALLKLKDPDPKYFTFLEGRGEAALLNDVPVPSERGEVNSVPYKERFDKWKKGKEEADVRVAVQAGLSGDPTTFLWIARSQDRRFIPILRRGLRFTNMIVASISAQALAGLGDKDSIPEIIRICESGSTDLAKGFALSSLLFFFDSKEAQLAFDRYFPDPEERRKLRTEAQKLGAPFVLLD